MAISYFELFLIYLSYLVNIIVVGQWIFKFSKEMIVKKSIHSFYSQDHVDIYIPLRYMENQQRYAVSNEDFFSVLKIAQFLNKYKISSSYIQIKEDTHIEIANDSIMICGPKSNSFVHDVLSYDPNFRFSQNDNTWMIIDKRNNITISSPLDNTPPVNNDVAYVNRFKKKSKNVVIVAGIHSIGTMGAVDFLTNEKKLKKLHSQFRENNFSTVLISTFNSERTVIEDSEIYISPKQY